MLDAVLDWLFAKKRRALAAKLKHIVADDRIVRVHPLPARRPIFEGWRYLWVARRAAHAAA